MYITYSTSNYRKVAADTFVKYPQYDYLADIQDSLLQMDGKSLY